MDNDVTTYAPGNTDLGPSLQLGGSIPGILLGLICLLGITTNGIIVYRAILTYITAEENIQTADVYLFHKALFDLLLLIGSPFYVISVWNGYQISLFSFQCRLLVSAEFLAILLTNHVIIAIVFERYGRRIMKNDKPIDLMPKDAHRHFQANTLYSLLLCVGIVFVADEVTWRSVRSCGYNWPPGQNYHAMVFLLLFAIVYCISYFLFFLWGLDLLKLKFSKSPRMIQRRRSPISTEDNRRDRVALLSLLIHFCCWTPFWCYHLYLVKHYYRVRPTIHLPGGFHTDELFISSLMYLSASTNIVPSAIFIKEWSPWFWLKPLNSQSNVISLQGGPRTGLNRNTTNSRSNDGSGRQNHQNGRPGHVNTLSEVIELSHDFSSGQRSKQTVVTKPSFVLPSPNLPSTSS